jgi:hypothetical protein
MTATNRLPKNTNYLQPTKFLLTFDRTGDVQYFCQSINLPGVNIGQAQFSTPLVDLHVPDRKITHNPLSIQFNVDESLNTWQQLYAWFRSIASPTSFEERNRLTALQNANKSSNSNYSDATLTVLSSLNNPILTIRYYNCFPISLSDIQFDTTKSADDIISADASFMFDYFKFETA